MAEPIVTRDASGIAADGASFSVYEWRGSGPPELHVHHKDDEAWHVLEGSIHFRFADREIEATAGSTVFVPAGCPHTYGTDDARYLIVLTPRLRQLIDELHRSQDLSTHAEIYRKHDSELLE
jgi:quercetin dioxygenase-like cupin family protein